MLCYYIICCYLLSERIRDHTRLHARKFELFEDSFGKFRNMLRKGKKILLETSY